jgi:hypothetical protein
MYFYHALVFLFFFFLFFFPRPPLFLMRIDVCRYVRFRGECNVGLKFPKKGLHPLCIRSNIYTRVHTSSLHYSANNLIN